MKYPVALAVLALLSLGGCALAPRPLKYSFGERPSPAAPAYSSLAYWAAHPAKQDNADCVPRGHGSWTDNQEFAEADVFFLYPTGHLNYPEWNTDVNSRRYNSWVSWGLIKRLATPFNGSCRVYAPYYRQACLYSYTDTTGSGAQAFDLAYSDVVAAWRHYLQYENKGRPFFLAGHSQGAQHILRLLRQEIWGRPVASRMVAAYALGLPNEHLVWPQDIPFCSQPGQTGCWLCYNTFADNKPVDQTSVYGFKKDHQVVNPLSWTTASTPVPAANNNGSVNLWFRRLHRPVFGARADSGLVYTQLRRPTGFPHMGGDYHISDVLIYYGSIRQNVQARLLAWQAQQTKGVK